VTSTAPLVGRAPELARVAEVLAGRGQALLVMADAGVGKSRLVAEAAQVVAARGVRVVAGRCLPLSAGLPLLPVMDLLRRLSEVDGGRLWSQLLEGSSDSVRRDLARLVPQAEGGPATADVLEAGGDWQQARLFDALRQVLGAAGQRRVAMLVEDVHWADRATRDLLEYLLASADLVPLPIVLTCRTGEIIAPEVSEWVNGLRRLTTVSFVALEPFSRADAVRHVLSLAGDRVDELDIDSVVRRSEGNAFFLEQLVSSVLQDRADGTDEPDGGAKAGANDGAETRRTALPKGLSSVLLARTRQVDGEALEIMSCLAVTGDAVGEEYLADCCGMTVPSVRHSLHELTRRHLLRSRADGAISLAHALLGEVIVADMLAGELRDWHLRVAAGLQSDAGEARAAAIAEHYRQGGWALEELQWRIRAAQHADSLFAPGLSSVQWERAVALSDELDGSDGLLPVLRPRLYLSTARALYDSGQSDAAVDVAETAFKRFGDDADERTRAALLAALGTYGARRQPDEARSSLRDAVRAYERLAPDLGYLDAAYSYVDCIHTLPEFAEVARAVNSRALAAAPTLDAPDQHLKLLLQRAWLDMASGDVEDALEKIGQARTMLTRTPSPYASLQFASWYGEILLKLGRPDEVSALAELAGMADWSRFMPRESEVMSILRANLCMARLQRGETEAAAAAIDPVTTSSPIRDMWLTHAYRATLDMLRGHLSDSAERWRQLPRTGEGQDDYELEPFRVELSLWLGRPHEAFEHGLDILQERATAGEPRLWGPLLLVTVRGHADIAERERSHGGTPERTASSRGSALSALHDAMPDSPFAPGPMRPTADADALLWTAEWHRAEGTSDPFLWEAAADAYARHVRPHSEAYARWRQAQALLARSPRARDVAPVLPLAARAAYGHEPLLAAIRRLAERVRVNLDIPLAPAEPAAPLPFGLTSRELTVLGMVAGGSTNRQIGRELFISEKTASVHVSNILRKLQVTNRLEAAAVAEQSGLLATDGGGGDTGDRTVSSTG
jgi:DNA-binding CsgD family transcriptional regulator/tetratricopeptide (TPR) repeat protein